MLKSFSKIILPLIFLGIFIFVVLQVPYPENSTQINILQFLSFFIPLFFAISFTINLFLKNILSSSVISLGIIFLLILKALDSLNIILGIIIILAVGLLVSYFQKNTKKKSLTIGSKIPKLTRLNRRNSNK